MPRAVLLIRLLLVLSVSLSTQGLLLIEGAFAVRQEYVAEHLCVNRDVPHAHCHGRCFLKKQVERHQEQQDRTPLALVQAVVMVALVGQGCEVPARPEAVAAAYAAFVAGEPPPGFPADVFEPPRAA